MRLGPAIATLGLLLLALIPHTVAEDVGNKTIVVEDVYFPGDVVIVRANFLPTNAYILDPDGNVHQIKFGKDLTAKYHLRKNVILGHYRVVADNVTAEFVVDSWAIKAGYSRGRVVGNVSHYYVEPKFIEYRINNVSGEAPIKNGNFEIPLKSLRPGKYKIILKCGNAVEKLKISQKLEILVDGITTDNGTAIVEGRVVLDGEPVEASLTYWFDGGELRTIAVNGTFNLTFTNVSGKLHIEAYVGDLVAKKDLKISAIKRVVEVGKRYFVNDSVNIVTNFKPKKALILDPSGKKHKLKFNAEDGVYKAVFELKKSVVLGNYTVIVDDIVKRFVVDFCSISADFDGALAGTVKCHFVHPEFVNYSIFGEGYLKMDSVRVNNGNFTVYVELPAGKYSAVVEYGNAREVVNFTVNLPIRDLYFLGDVIDISMPFKAERAFIIAPDNKSIKLNFSEQNGRYHASFVPDRVGRYELVVDGLKKVFIVDDYSINASLRNSTIFGCVRWHYVAPERVEYTITQLNISGSTKVVNGKFEVPLQPLALPSGSYDACIRAGNAEMVLRVVVGVNVTVPKTAFVGEPIRVLSNFMPKVAYVVCGNETFNLSFHEYAAEFSVKHAGVCRVVLDSFSREIVVDDYTITAEFRNGSIDGSVEYHFIQPEFVKYKILPTNISGRVGAVNGSFSLQLDLPPGNYTAVLKCGNAITELNFTVEEERRLEVGDILYFTGDVVEIRANFKPKFAAIQFNSTTEKIEFANVNGTWVYKFVAKNASVYRVVADGVVTNFTVDDYKIEASLHDKTVEGRVLWHYIEPKVAEYVVLPENVTHTLILKNGSFEFTVPENTTAVVIRCGNAEKIINIVQISDRRTLKIEYGSRILMLNVSVDKGKFRVLEAKEDNVTMVISNLKPHSIANITINLPFEIPPGMHVYYWKTVDGKMMPVNYTLSADRRSLTFRVQDGVVDEDGKANGVIVDPIIFYIPRFDVKSDISGSRGVLHITSIVDNSSFEIRVDANRGRLAYLALVDSANLPDVPAVFPYQLVKFRVEGLNPGEDVEVKITYSGLPTMSATEHIPSDLPNLPDLTSPPSSNLTSELSKLGINNTPISGITYYKFSPYKLKWMKYPATIENGTVVLRLKDGGEGDEDGKANGVIEDDGGVGWVGYTGKFSVAIPNFWYYRYYHIFRVYVPSGNSFWINFTGSGSGSFWIRNVYRINVFYPNGTLATNYNITAWRWDVTSNTLVLTNNVFGLWWIAVMYTPYQWTWNGWVEYISSNLENYGIIFSGANKINTIVQRGYYVNGAIFYGSNTFDIVGTLASFNDGHNYWYVGDNFRLAVFNVNTLTVDVYYPNGTLYNTFTALSNNNWDIFKIEGPYGAWKIRISDTSSSENWYVLAVNDPNGLWLKKPELINVTGKVFDDIYPLGANNGEDTSLENVTVALFEDDGNGVLDVNDRLVAISKTNESGYYSFKVVKDISKTYIVAVDSKTIGAELNAGYTNESIWAEQTYQVEWDGNSYSTQPKFGGKNPEISDQFGIIFFDDFEKWSGWQDYGLGSVYQSNYTSLRGIHSLEKNDNNDPNGGYKKLPYRIGRDVVVEGWIYRPNGWSGGPIDRIGLEDEKFDGYSISVNHNSNRIWIDARTSGISSRISSPIAWNPPEDEWYFFRFYIFSNGTIRFEVYNITDYFSGTPSATVIANNASYDGFDRVVVHGGYEYYIDDLSVKLMNPNYEHYTAINTTKYVGGSIDFGFSFDVIVNTKDVDDDHSNPRVAQGELRQFILNSNAIAGKQRSYFVMTAPPNSQDSNGRWWTIAVNDTLGTLPPLTDEVQLNGTVFRDNMLVNDTNPGCMIYNYSSHELETCTCSTTISVGTGKDGVPFSGDESKLLAIPRPEIEIYAPILGSVINITANNSEICSFSLFGASTNQTEPWKNGYGIKVGLPDGSTENLLIKKVFVGLRANASNPRESGMEINGYAGIGVYANNTTVAKSVVAFNNGTGILFWGDSVDYGVVREVIAFSNGVGQADGVAMEGWVDGAYNSRAENVTVMTSILSKNAGFGVDSWFGKRGLTVANSTVEFNGFGSERGGIRILANDSVIKNNLIRWNNGSGVVVGRMTNYPTYGIIITKNSIYNNSRIGIDIDPRPNYVNSYDGDNVTLNDGEFNLSQPNCGIDYPIIANAYITGTSLLLTGFIGNESTGANTSFTATVEVYLVRNSTNGDSFIGNNLSSTSVLSKHYGEGWIYLGEVNAVNGVFSGTIDVTGKGLDQNSYISAISRSGCGTSEFGPVYYMLKKVNVTAGITVFWDGESFNATLSVTAHNDADFLRVYWIKPTNATLLTATGDFDSGGSSGDVYWWQFNSMPAGTTKHVYLRLDGDFSMIEALNIGVDPTNHPSKGI